MTIIEARFHPRGRGEAGVIRVAHIHCAAGWSDATIEPLDDLKHAVGLDPGEAIGKIRCLVTALRPDLRRSLLELRSDYWSFVELPPSDHATAPPEPACVLGVFRCRSCGAELELGSELPPEVTWRAYHLTFTPDCRPRFACGTCGRILQVGRKDPGRLVCDHGRRCKRRVATDEDVRLAH